MNTTKYIIVAISFFFALLSSTSCKEKKTEVVYLGEYVPLQATINSTLVMPSDELIYSLSVLDPDNKGLTLNENIDVKLDYLVSVDGKIKEDISVNDIFEEVYNKISLKRGAKAGFVAFKVKKSLERDESLTVTIKASSRGYQINGNTKDIAIVSKPKTVVSMVGSSDNTVDEGGKFILRLQIPKAHSKDIVVNISTQEQDKFIDLPSSLTIKKGFVYAESHQIGIKAVSGKNNFSNLTLNFSTQDADYPLLKESMNISVRDLDGGLDPNRKLLDENWVYLNPNIVFMSQKNKKAVEAWGKTKNLQLMNPGDPHPNAELAQKGWKLINAMEFTPIDALGKVNEYGNRPSAFFGDQTVAGTQKVQAVHNDKYTDQTEDGYLLMWSSRYPGIKTREYAEENRDYGSAALYQNKYRGNVADTWKSSQVKILPGTRIEFRLRMRGQLWGFNPAVWLQGNKENQDQWSYYGEVDILEAPFFANGATGAWQTFHWNDKKDVSGDKWAPTSNSLALNLNEFNIYWVEWRSNDEIAIGVNGVETVKVTKSSQYTHWPFDDIYNPSGMHLLITFVANNDWAFGKQGRSDWDKYLKDIPYQGSKTNPNTPRVEIDWIRYYKTDSYKYDPFNNGKDYMY